jgi:hypothetical protein
MVMPFLVACTNGSIRKEEFPCGKTLMFVAMQLRRRRDFEGGFMDKWSFTVDYTISRNKVLYTLRHLSINSFSQGCPGVSPLVFRGIMNMDRPLFG